MSDYNGRCDMKKFIYTVLILLVASSTFASGDRFVCTSSDTKKDEFTVLTERDNLNRVKREAIVEWSGGSVRAEIVDTDANRMIVLIDSGLMTNMVVIYNKAGYLKYLDTYVDYGEKEIVRFKGGTCKTYVIK